MTPDEVRRLIAARCPEVTEDEIVALAEPDADALPAEIGAQIIEVLGAMEAKLDVLAERLDTMATRMDKVET